MSAYTTSSSVLLIIFNRPDTTLLVFEEIKKVRPYRLFIAADGPRMDRPEDITLCAASRNITSLIDWDCEVKTLFREQNMGCKRAVSSAITWFFDQVDEGIILEDDCLPASCFFNFCDQMLDRYRDDNRIRHIAGCNLLPGKQAGNSSYFFTESTNVWGWATWKRVWNDYDVDLKDHKLDEILNQLARIFDDVLIREKWANTFRELKAGKIDTWDYQLAFINYFNHGLSINPNVNLVTNIGFRADATHTPDPDSQFANIPIKDIGVVTHPKYFLPAKEFDNAFFEKEFALDVYRRKHFSVRRRFKRWVKKLMTTQVKVS